MPARDQACVPAIPLMDGAQGPCPAIAVAALPPRAALRSARQGHLCPRARLPAPPALPQIAAGAITPAAPTGPSP